MRPKYTREMLLKSWTLGEDYSLMYIMEPTRDKGTTYLKDLDSIIYHLLKEILDATIYDESKLDGYRFK